MMDRFEDHIEVMAGQLVAQNMLIQVLMGQVILQSADRGVGIRHALEEGIGIMQCNPNLSTREKFGAIKRLEDAQGMFDQTQQILCKPHFCFTNGTGKKYDGTMPHMQGCGAQVSNNPRSPASPHIIKHENPGSADALSVL